MGYSSRVSTRTALEIHDWDLGADFWVRHSVTVLDGDVAVAGHLLDAYRAVGIDRDDAAWREVVLVPRAGHRSARLPAGA